MFSDSYFEMLILLHFLEPSVVFQDVPVYFFLINYILQVPLDFKKHDLRPGGTQKWTEKQEK